MADVICTRGLAKTYRLGRVLVPALNGVDLAITRGEFVAVMGPSGSGKSTLLNLIGLLDTPTGGSLLVDGREVSQMSERERADFRLHHIGFIFQFFNLFFELSALENVMLPIMMAEQPGRQCRSRAMALLGMVGLADRVNHRPAQLSGGEQQRVAIARALANDPALLLADEPTGSLDSATAGAVLDLLRQLNVEHGQTIVLVTHEEDWGARADRVIRLRDGKAVEAGVH